MSTLFAFLHHAAAFVLFAALVVELVTLKDELSAAGVRRLLLYDAVYGVAAGLVLTVGLLRVHYFEKGAAYYWSNAAFIAKLALFIAVGLLSIYPTVTFLAWRRALKRGETPRLDDATRRRLRRVIHTELTFLVLMMLLAALMARGVGS